MVNWRESWRAERAARVLADGHYTRQKVGADQFVPPGRCTVFVIPEEAYWVTSWPFAEYVKHAWAGAWVCSAFRNVHPTDPSLSPLHRSSDLIVEALACTRWYWSPPPLGMITFVDPSKTRRKRDPGRCFRKAGFHVVTRKPDCEACVGRPMFNKSGQITLHIAPDAMPAALQPLGAQSLLAGLS